MQRYTKKQDQAYVAGDEGIKAVEGGYSGAAIDRLAAYESLHQDVLQNYRQLSIELEQLRAQGKMKSLRFKELMGKKLMSAHIISLLKLYDLDTDESPQ